MIARRAVFAMAAMWLTMAVASAADKYAFEIYPDAKGESRWRLKNDDKIIATSGQGYSKKADCKKMCENLKADISKYEIELYEDNKKEQRFRVKAKNGNTVGASNGSYATKAEAEKVIEALKKSLKDATISEVEK